MNFSIQKGVAPQKEDTENQEEKTLFLRGNYQNCPSLCRNEKIPLKMRKLNKVSTFQKKSLRKRMEMSTFAKGKALKKSLVTTFKNRIN